MSVSRDVFEHVEELKDRYKDISTFEALQIATKIAEIEAFRQANVIDTERGIPALEAIAICLGMGSQFSYTITNALSDVSGSLNGVATAIEKKLSASIDNVATAVENQGE